VWFELHEHLLASLGLDRSSEARTDTEPDGSHRPSTLRDAPRGAPTSTQSDPKPDDPSPHPPPDGLRSPSQEAT
jgi:hypothetical protein